MTDPELVEDFFGVYLLICLNPRYKGRTYVGYTRNPNRRIRQHNRGTWAGGAHRTSDKGPWKMVLIVHGFPNNISALRFEWAWQNPNKTIRLQHLNLRQIPRKESSFKFKLRVLSEMVNVGPWSRLPLLIRWLESDYYEEFPVERKPPDHMIVCHGPIKSKNLKKSQKNDQITSEQCSLCSKHINNSQTKLKCLNTSCKLTTHITCLADIFLSPGEYIPIQGKCPSCKMTLKWGDLIRKMKGCEIEISDACQIGTDFATKSQIDTVAVVEDVIDVNMSEPATTEAHKVYNGYEEYNDYPSWFDDCEDS